MTYGYIRVSTDTQNTENQKMEIEKFSDRLIINRGQTKCKDIRKIFCMGDARGVRDSYRSHRRRNSTGRPGRKGRQTPEKAPPRREWGRNLRKRP